MTAQAFVHDLVVMLTQSGLATAEESYRRTTSNTPANSSQNCSTPHIRSTSTRGDARSWWWTGWTMSNATLRVQTDCLMNCPILESFQRGW